MNLANIKYSKVHKRVGGPIEKIAVGQIELFGTPAFQAYTHLDSALVPITRQPVSLYGNCDGTGTHQSKAGAIYRAVSEALERWASYSSVIDKDLSILAMMDVDCSTTGFAAFPGLFARETKKFALQEAIERWALKEWWEGRLGHSFLLTNNEQSLRALVVPTNLFSHVLVIAWKNTDGRRAYGFAASRDVQTALKKAYVELFRNLTILPSARANLDPIRLSQNETKILYFASSEGQAKFDERINARVVKSSSSPLLIVDRNIPGPWNRFANVWRCLFEATHQQDPADPQYFYF